MVQVLNNRSFTNFNLNIFDEAIKDAEHVLSLDPNNLKGLYRRGLSYYEKSKLLRSIGNSEKDQDKLLDTARFDIEKLLKLNKENPAAREKLEEIVKESVKIKLKLRDSKPSNPAPNPEPKKPAFTKPEPSKFDNEFINNVTFDVSKKVIQNLINSKELPSTANAFEKDCMAFKNDIEKLFYYLKKIPFEDFTKLFTKKDIPTEVLLMIIETIRKTGVK